MCSVAGDLAVTWMGTVLRSGRGQRGLIGVVEEGRSVSLFAGSYHPLLAAAGLVRKNLRHGRGERQLPTRQVGARQSTTPGQLHLETFGLAGTRVLPPSTTMRPSMTI